MALSDNLVAYWKLDEASGTRVDATGRGNDLTDTNSNVSQQAGKNGSAAGFVAANSTQLTHLDNTDLAPGPGDMTLAGWVWADVVTGDQGVVGKWGNDYLLEIFSSALYWNCGGASPNIAFASTGVWIFVICQWDNAAKVAGISLNNGTLVTGSGAGLTHNVSAAFRMGVYNAAFFSGRLDEWGKWTRLLSASEKTALYNGGAGITYPFPASNTSLLSRRRKGLLV